MLLSNATVAVPLSIQRTFTTGHINNVTDACAEQTTSASWARVSNSLTYREEGCLYVSYTLLPINAKLQACSALAMVSVGLPLTVTSMGLVALKYHWRASLPMAEHLFLPSCLFSATAFYHGLCEGGAELVLLPGERLVP